MQLSFLVQSNCNLNVIKYCMGAIVVTVVIDLTVGLFNCRKKSNQMQKHNSFYQKTVGFLLEFFYLLPDGKINKF